MTTDRELLGAAAKAAGLIFNNGYAQLPTEDWPYKWDPLTNDGDALRLAVKLTLKIDITPWATDCGRWDKYSSSGGTTDAYQSAGDDHAAATRRAIVRAAASMAPKGGDDGR